MERLTEKALDFASGSCIFVFQGGEPTLRGLPFFRRALIFQQKYNRHGVKIHNTIQTNGVLVDGDWAEFFARNNFLVGVSLDGAPELHDLYRKSAEGGESAAKALNAIRLLERHGAEYNILSVITAQAAKRPAKYYQFCKKHGAFLQPIACIAPDGSPYALSAQQYGNFLCRLFDLWYGDLTQGNYISVRIFDNFVQTLAGHPPESCSMRGVCSMQTVVEADGSVYPCDFYVLDEYRLGNILTDEFPALMGSPVLHRFLEESRPLPEKCRGCRFLALCRGGCRRDRTPDGTNRFCESYRQFFSHALPRMELIVSRMTGNPN